MSAPIRDMDSLVEAVRSAQIERNLSYETLDAISGLQSGYTAKVLGPSRNKGLGPITMVGLLGALGKALVLVDDPEQIKRVERRWSNRIIKGGATLQMRAREAKAASASTSASIDLSARMREIRKLVKKENLVKSARAGGKARARRLKKAARQRIAAHAVRMRWSKRNGNHQQG